MLMNDWTATMTKQTREEMEEKNERKTMTVFIAWRLDADGNRVERLEHNFRIKRTAEGNARQMKNWFKWEVEESEMDFREYKDDLRKRMARAHPDVEGVCIECNEPFWKDGDERVCRVCKGRR